MAHVARHDTNVACHVVEGACVALGGEDGDASAALLEVRPVSTLSVLAHTGRIIRIHVPLIGIRVPVHLAHRTRLNVKVCGCDRLGDGEVLAVHDAGFSTATLNCRGVKHMMSVLVL